MNFATSTPYDPRIGVADRVRGIPPHPYEIRDSQKVVSVMIRDWRLVLPPISNLLKFVIATQSKGTGNPCEG